MKLYRVSIGHTELFAAGIDEADIYNRRESLDHTFAYLPIVIEEVKLEGYTINVSADAPVQGISDPSHIVHTLDRDGLKSWLSEHDVEFVPQWGEQKLRELAIANT
jgi:hypothetical protein